MTTPDHDESRPCRRWRTYLAVVLVMAFVAYPLSFGPVYALTLRSGDETALRAVDSLYLPLIRTAKVTGLSRSLRIYYCWCIQELD
jgi:hypothetical protein